MLDITLSAHFGATAANWADNLFEEIGEKDERSIREFVDKAVLPDMVGEVCRACEQRGIRNPDTMEAYAKHAVTQFDKRLNALLAKRQTVH
jgi:hypothetical protein